MASLLTSLALVGTIMQASALPLSVSLPGAAATTGKGGLVYTTAASTSLFNGPGLSWAYNWAQTTNGNINSGLEFVPMLWGLKGDMAQTWAGNAQAAIDSGSKYLLGFNEPDLASENGANMSPAAAAQAWMTNMQPFAGKAKLVSPAVTNGAAPMGLSWLSDFMGECQKLGCTIDAVAIHWYDSVNNFPYFQKYMNDAHTAFPNTPIWLTEFGTTDGTDEQKANFLSTQAIPFLNSQSYIERYSYFLADKNSLLNTVGDALSATGLAYVAASVLGNI